MRKQELVHLHVLFWEVRSQLESDLAVSESAFEDYDEFGVPPTAIYRSKDTHRRAIQHLLGDLERTIGSDTTIEVDASADD